MRMIKMEKIFLSLFFVLIWGIPSHTYAKHSVPILVYHSIDDYSGQGPRELYVTPENFEKQMLYLKKHGFTLLTLEHWQDISKVKKPIFITFDDGYKNNLNAFAIYKKLKDESFNPTGTIFVISDFVGRSNRLSQSELKRLSDSGFFSIQSHTATHPYLTKTKDYNHEIKEAKVKIEKITGKPVIALAYPYGEFNDEVISVTKKYYQYGLTTIPGPYKKTGVENELYLLPRIYVKNSTTIEEFSKLVNE
jgi:peptidoglycan/xylan/chitin deacetylase (PgdA/CDA1 family)